MKDALLINCVFLFPYKNSFQLTVSIYSDRAAELVSIRTSHALVLTLLNISIYHKIAKAERLDQLISFQ
jgi:hypothetical protein